MYIFTAYIQASVLTSVRKRIRIWSRASIKAHHLLRCSRLPFFSISPGLRDTLTSFRSPRSGDPRADIWPVSQTGETNLRLRFFFISFDSWCSFCKVGWRGFDKRQKKRKLIMGWVMQREVNLCKLTKVDLEWMSHISEHVWQKYDGCWQRKLHV